MQRIVVEEVLDGLPADDAHAIRSRRDLQRIHRAMGSCTILTRALRKFSIPRTSSTLRVLEIGAGDGSLMLRVAQRLAPAWPPVSLCLLDRQSLVSTAARAGYAQLGWTVTSEICNVLDWAKEPDAQRWDFVIANLFLHHFENPPLQSLLQAVAARSQRFVACEPRRAAVPLLASRLVGALGANAVTREDAVLSVRAGFRDRELSALWPAKGFSCEEYAAGPFSHCFRAERLVSMGMSERDD